MIPETAAGPETRAWRQMQDAQERLRGEDVARRDLHAEWLAFGERPWWWQMVHRKPRPR